MTTVTLRLDDATKQELDDMVEEMGMNLTTFFMVYAKRALRDRRIPFDITAPVDPFYSESNMAHLRHSMAQMESGKTIIKSMSELESMENG